MSQLVEEETVSPATVIQHEQLVVRGQIQPTDMPECLNA
jgi:hypothetical protein